MPKNNVKKVLKEKGMSMADLSKKMDITYEHLVKTINGYNRPSEMIRKETSKILKVDAKKLWGE